MKSLLFFPVFVVVAILLASCGGGSGSSGPVVPKLSLESSTGDEKSGVIFNLILDKALVDNISFKYRIEAGTAGQADFASTVQLNTEIDGLITNNSRTMKIVIEIKDDRLVEEDETFSLILSKVRGAVFEPAEKTLTVIGTILDGADADGNGLIEIGTPAEMNNIRYNLAGTSYKTSETDTGDTIGCPVQGCGGYELVDNIDLVSFTNWVPIQGGYTAIFDGKGNTISNLTVNSSTGVLGLFGAVSGTLRNFKLRGGLITGGSRTGTVAGYLASAGKIENVSSYTTISGSGSVGGLVGHSDGTIRDSEATGNVTGGAGVDSVGGLVGHSDGTIRDSEATGNVTGEAGNDRVGGLVGDNNNGTIQGSNATGDVNGGADSDWVGGLAGGNGSTDTGGILNSYTTGAVSGGAGSDSVGGLVGVNSGITQNSYAIGAITGEAGNDRVGGLVGINNPGKTVQNSYYAISDATVAVKGGAGIDYVGGLAGLSFGTVQNSYALVNVDGGDGDGDYVGRVVGNSEGSGVVFGNYYSTAFTLEGENERTVGTDEVKGKDTSGLKALTAAITGTDFTSGVTTDGWSTNNWDFTADFYPSLKSYKVDEPNASDVQVEGDLLCTQGTDWVQC